MDRILIFAGTTEGRLLTEALCRDASKDREVTVCVATQYGKDLLPQKRERLRVWAGRMERHDMESLISRENISTVVDATHPYADKASDNIRGAAEATGATYIRLLRGSSKTGDGHMLAPDVKSAVECLKGTEGNVLLTIGSKELAAFTELEGFSQRLYPRILPEPGVIKRAFELGYDAGHIIAMQGPFSKEMNVAMLHQTKAAFLVTKESGKAGGFDAKLEAADEAGAKAVIIGRPAREDGYSLEQVMEMLGISGAVAPEAESSWFPFFIDIKEKSVLVAGAGAVASRRAAVLAGFGASVTVVAPEISEELMKLWKGGRLVVRSRVFEEDDLEGMDMVIAATGSRETNRLIGGLCRKRDIPVNVADRREECDFYFPAIVRKKGITVGLTAGGADHRLAAEGKRIVSRAFDIWQEEAGEKHE